MRQENLSITGVTTSFKTETMAQNLGIKIIDIDDVATIDLTIDGADEVDYDMNGIKGGGAAFLMEKIVATNSKRIVWIVDSQKVHLKLGLMPLPLEVVPFGSGKLMKIMDHFRKEHIFMYIPHHVIVSWGPGPPNYANGI